MSQGKQTGPPRTSLWMLALNLDPKLVLVLSAGQNRAKAIIQIIFSLCKQLDAAMH